MQYRVAAGLVAALLMISCSTASPTAPNPVSPSERAPSIRVSGRVLDYRTGSGVAGQSVHWSTGSNSHLIVRPSNSNTVTDASGRFQLEVPVATDGYTPLADTDRLLFEMPEAFGSIRIPAKSLETNILINPGTCNVRYGYVYDAVTGQPLANATVSRGATVTTDVNGFYRLEIMCNAPQDQYWGIGTTTISASHSGYQSAWQIDGRSEWTGRPAITRVDWALTPLTQ